MKRIAIIGGGISGLSAAYFLSRRHEVSVFEREARLGGHTNTVRIYGPEGPIALDTGFIVHNEQTYPNLVRLFAELGVATQPSDMSFSVSCRATGLEFSSRGSAGFFAQWGNIVKLDHYRLLKDITRFHREAPSVLRDDDAANWTMDDFVRRHNFGTTFVDKYLLPMTSAIWSAPATAMRGIPIRTLVQFMQNHGMLSIGAHVTWRVVCGGSDTYVTPLIRPFRDRVQCGVSIASVSRDTSGVTVAFSDGQSARFDEVVFACHGDQVLPLLRDPSAREQEVLSSFLTTTNETVLHTDAGILPSAARARASWNYRIDGDASKPPTVTYDLNRLQGLRSATQYCVTLNPRQSIANERVIARFTYRHPQMTAAAVRAQASWRLLSGVNRTHYCGAYWRYGFHEDGLMSALRVAADCDVTW